VHPVTAIFLRILTFVKNKLEGNLLNIPGSRPLPDDDNGTSMLFVIEGEESVALSQRGLRPYSNRNLGFQAYV